MRTGLELRASHGGHDGIVAGESVQLAIEGRQRLGEGIGHERRQAIA